LDVTVPFTGLLALSFALAFLFFVGLWWRLRRGLRQIDNALANLRVDGHVPAEFPLPVKPADIALLLTSLNDAVNDAQSKLAAVTAERDADREAAQQADRSKTRFLAAASHDLRQPLQALGLFVAVLVQRSLPDDIREIVRKIESSLESLEQLLDGLLDISRLDAGTIEAHSVVFPMQSLFDRMAQEFEPLANRKALSFRLVHTTAIVRSDPALIERILRNLLSNAIRYTRSGGIVVGCRRRGEDLRVEVWDSGPGIALYDQKEIFQEFRQLNNNPSKGRQGLGLGLAIVERLANLLGLQVKLHSTVGKGSMFAIILPLETQRIGRINGES